MKSLLIDDIRNIQATKVARTFDEGMVALQEGGWDYLYLDHDLADPDPKKTGYEICCFLETHPELRPKIIQLVTSNPVGLRNMARALRAMGYEDIYKPGFLGVLFGR